MGKVPDLRGFAIYGNAARTHMMTYVIIKNIGDTTKCRPIFLPIVKYPDTYPRLSKHLPQRPPLTFRQDSLIHCRGERPKDFHSEPLYSGLGLGALIGSTLMVTHPGLRKNRATTPVSIKLSSMKSLT